MRRKRRLFSILLLPLIASCAMLREGNPATTAGSNFGPCGSWVDCGPDQPKSDRCCPPQMACTVDDAGPYCAADSTYDPSDPVTWGAKKRVMRSARGTDK